MRKFLLITSFLITFVFSNAQGLDHLSLTSGGDAANEMNYILGEVFVFELNDGNITINGGPLGGGDLPDGIMEAVKEKSDCDLINCYPNPAHLKITVDFYGVGNNVSNLIVLNEIGQAVLQLNNPTTTNVGFGVQELPVGAYYVVLLDGNKVVCVNKFVKH